MGGVTPLYTPKSHPKPQKTPILNPATTHQPTKNPLNISGLDEKKNGAGDEIRSYRTVLDSQSITADDWRFAVVFTPKTELFA